MTDHRSVPFSDTGISAAIARRTRRVTDPARPTSRRRRPPISIRHAAAAFAVIVLAAMSPASAAEFAPDQRQAIEAIIHDYLLKNPDVLIEALQAADDKMKTDAHDKTAKALTDRRKEIFDDPATPVGGNPQGDATMVEFFDYRCPYCKQVQPEIEALLRDDRQLRLVYKEMPVLGPASLVAARAALAAVKQGKYVAFHTAMMEAKGQITDDTVYQVAGSVGLDVARLKKDMAAPEISQALKANLDLAEALDIRGTPAFVVNNEIIPGAVDIANLKELIADARKQ